MRSLLLLTAFFAATPLAARPTAIHDTTVINPRDGSVRAHMTVLVEDDRIVAVQPARARLPRNALRISGRGRFLIPGLWDAHTHLSKVGANGLALNLANGVTGVRDMGSNLTEILVWRRRIDAGALAGPRIRLSGPMIEAQSNLERLRRQNSVEAVGRQRIGVSDPESGRAAVRRFVAAGVDQVKLRTAPDAATFTAIATEARRLRVPFAAHPRPVDDMLAARLSSAEHFLTYPPLQMDEAGRRALFRRVAASGLHVSNTMIVYRGVSTPYETGRRILADSRSATDPRRRYICGYLLRDWREQLEEAREGGFGDIAAALPNWHRDFREMHQEGVRLLAGSDAAVLFTYPGFSLHDQLEIMVTDGGLQPMAVLRIATSGLPEYFGEADRIGAIAPGQAADLVLLDANPLVDIRNTRAIRGVMAQGRWWNRRALDRLLRSTASDAAGACAGGSSAGLREDAPSAGAH